MKHLYTTKKMIVVECLFALALSVTFILLDTSRRFLEQHHQFNRLAAKLLTGDTGYLLGDLMRLLSIVGAILLIGTMVFCLFFIVNNFQTMYLLSQHDIQIMAFLGLAPKEIVRQIFLRKIKGILMTFFIIILIVLSAYSLLYYVVFPINIQKVVSHNYDMLMVLFMAYLLLAITLFLTSEMIKFKIGKRYFIR
ncbi:hypothetical protein ACWN83_03775 [Pseudolactococcus plantarum]|nr:hypothetical protein [Lactococcus plantarum]HCN74905.1 hypothetical protein [Lactococcus sp.]